MTMRETIEERIAYIRKIQGCETRMINGTVSIKCGGCNCYDGVEQKCDIRDEAILGLNEDAWDADHDYLDPHPRSEDD
jgi:hypothetical protein